MRGLTFDDEYAPEDWVGSTATVFGDSRAGLSVLPDGRLLRDAVAADPKGFLGAAHLHRYGAGPALLVKLLDAAERLPVHCHPDRGFAREHLGMRYGKTEGWLIVEARGASPRCTSASVRRLTRRRSQGGWSAKSERGCWRPCTCFRSRPATGCSFRPGYLTQSARASSSSSSGAVRPVGALEWAGFAVDGTRDGHLGLGFDVALRSVTLARVETDELAALHRSPADGSELRPGARRLLPPQADPYFRAEDLRPDPVVSLGPNFSVLIVLEGHGSLETEHGRTLELRRGETVLVPHAAGAAELTGTVEAIRCLPPPS